MLGSAIRMLDSCGLDIGGLSAALAASAALSDEAARAGAVPSATVLIGNHNGAHRTHVITGKESVRADSIFPVASVTKAILATAIMRLVDQQHLRLDARIVDFVPG